jgi:hypothetical protein
MENGRSLYARGQASRRGSENKRGSEGERKKKRTGESE